VFGAVRKKNPNLGLSRYLKNGDRIPLVEGNYRSAPQLRRGVYDYLGKARGKHHADVAFLAVPEEVFTSLWEDAEYDHAPASSPGALAEDSFRDQHGGSPLTTEEILPFLSYEEIPDELRKGYLRDSPDAQLVRVLIPRATRFRNTSVLLTGETGTGKQENADAPGKKRKPQLPPP